MNMKNDVMGCLIDITNEDSSAVLDSFVKLNDKANLPRKLSQSIYTIKDSKEAWANLIEERNLKIMELEAADFNILDIFLNVGVNIITDVVMKKIEKEYEMKNPSKLELIKMLLGDRKNKTIYYKKWEF